jgi:hypothetical protein
MEVVEKLKCENRLSVSRSPLAGLGCPTEILPTVRTEIYVDGDNTSICVDLQIDRASVI